MEVHVQTIWSKMRELTHETTDPSQPSSCRVPCPGGFVAGQPRARLEAEDTEVS